jgi:hypothetical protein
MMLPTNFVARNIAVALIRMKRSPHVLAQLGDRHAVAAR